MRVWLLLLAALSLLSPGVGCATYDGGRLYVSGTDALDRGDTGRAIADLERAAELVPHASEVQNHLGLAYAADGREAEAEQAFERAVALDCGNDAAKRNLRAARGTDGIERAALPASASGDEP
jgi:Flp pilus assembly protein TadD